MTNARQELLAALDQPVIRKDTKFLSARNVGRTNSAWPFVVLAALAFILWG